MHMDGRDQLEQIESIRHGIAEIEEGRYIPHETMKAWLLLGSDHKLPPPKCVCGKFHEKPRYDR